MYLNGLILYSVSKMNNERTIYATYNLFKGKKSIQTLHDAKLFNLEQFYEIYPQLSRQRFNKYIDELINDQLLFYDNEDIYTITKKGLLWLETNKASIPYHYFNGQARTGTIFFERLLLVIQTLTNTSQNHYSFIPIIEKQEITKWVKLFYREINLPHEKFLKQLYKELLNLLEHLQEKEASLVVDRLTGYKYYGMSVHQLANKYELNMDDVVVIFSGIIQYLLVIIQNQMKTYPLLNKLLEDIPTSNLITKSAENTYHLLKQNLTISQIAKIRRLKVNTIQDHIVEIALHQTYFPIDHYVTVEDQEHILHVVDQLQTHKLKVIKEAVYEHIDYFQIRLVLARRNYMIKER